MKFLFEAKKDKRVYSKWEFDSLVKATNNLKNGSKVDKYNVNTISLYILAKETEIPDDIPEDEIADYLERESTFLKWWVIISIFNNLDFDKAYLATLLYVEDSDRGWHSAGGNDGTYKIKDYFPAPFELIELIKDSDTLLPEKGDSFGTKELKIFFDKDRFDDNDRLTKWIDYWAQRCTNNDYIFLKFIDYIKKINKEKSIKDFVKKTEKIWDEKIEKNPTFYRVLYDSGLATLYLQKRWKHLGVDFGIFDD